MTCVVWVFLLERTLLIEFLSLVFVTQGFSREGKENHLGHDISFFFFKLYIVIKGMSEQLLVRLTKQNSSREMHSPIRRHIKKEEEIFFMCRLIGEYISLC